MPISQTIAPHLPYLRRFARAVTGSQASGDAYVVSVLETLVADPSAFPSDLDPRVALYRVFAQIWNSVPVNVSEHASPSSTAERNIENLTPRPRQAFLLTTVEGFSTDEAAAILGVSEAEVRALIDAAGREIAEQVATEVLIIEDEPIIAMDLEALVEGLGHQVMAVARTHREAVEAVRKRQPGLVLADIQLADGSSGIDAVKDILNRFDVPVIFITAFPERLLTGERPEPTFLITKPFDSDTLHISISQALAMAEAAGPRERA